MTAGRGPRLSVADVATYLDATGWSRGGERGPNAAIWVSNRRAGAVDEVLLPVRDDLVDRDRRLAETLQLLAEVEERSIAEVARAVVQPLADSQRVELGTGEGARRPPELGGGVRALRGLLDALTASARVADAGPHVAFTGRRSRRVGDFVGQVGVASEPSAGFAVTTLVPVSAGVADAAAGADADAGADAGVGAGAGEGASAATGAAPDRLDGDEPFGRRVVTVLYDALSATELAIGTGSVSAFDPTVGAGVSANLCHALAELATGAGDEPVVLDFRWAAGLPAEVPPRTATLPAGSAELLAAAAARLQTLAPSGEATITGLVDSLRDDPPAGERWRIRVRGTLASAGRVDDRRTLWVRLATDEDYAAALRAHRARVRVRAVGLLGSAGGRLVLSARRRGFEVLGEPA